MKKFKISLILLTFLFLGGTAFGQMDIERSVSGAINPGGTGLLFCTYSGGSCTFTALASPSTTPAASTIAEWDANVNLSAYNLIDGYATTATATTNTYLTVSSKYQQYFTGTATQSVLLPATSTLVLGQQYLIVNNSTQVVTVKASDASTVQAMAAATQLVVTCISTSVTTSAGWSASYASLALATGTANYIVLSAQTTSGAISAGMAAGNYYITNRGAGADVTLTAPQCGSNSYAVEFSVTDAYYLRVSAYSGDAFRYGATTGAANGYVRSNTIGTHWKATCNGNSYWDIHDLVGVLKYDQ